MRPASIVRFEWLYLLAIVLSLVGVAIDWGRMRAAYDADPNAAMLGAGFLYASIGISYAISLLLWWLVARRASNVARWVLVIFFAIALLTKALPLANGTYPFDLTGAIGLLATLVELVAIVQLFRPDAVDWLLGEEEEPA